MPTTIIIAPIRYGFRQVDSACLPNKTPAMPTGIDPAAKSHSSIGLPLSDWSSPKLIPKPCAIICSQSRKKYTSSRDQRAHVQGDIEGETLVGPAQQPGRERQVRGAADRQEFGYSLNNG